MNVTDGILRHRDNASAKVESILNSHPFIETFAREVKEAKLKVASNYEFWLKRAMKVVESMGGNVYFAEKSEDVRKIVKEIVGSGKLVVKSKSSVSEEVKLRSYLEKLGNEVWETDFGDLLVQLANDRAMHIIAPAIHYSEQDALKILKKIGVNADSVEEATRQVRNFMRDKFLRADVGISGCNAFSVETGRIFLVENEGNVRLSTSLPKVHIAVVSLEKLLPNDELCLKAALVQSAYAGVFPPSFINISQPNEKQEIHVIFLDNGRSKTPEEFKEILSCLKCGRCQMECPVFQVLGKEWGETYPGPMGLIFDFIITGRVEENVFFCLGCRKCNFVCPMKIDLTELMRKLKRKYLNVRRGSFLGRRHEF